MSEGGLGAPIRHAIAWEDESYYDLEAIDAEMRRVFDICHGCRRCFNLCDSFPRLFDLVDNSETGELDSVKSSDFKPVAEACTLCDMCFMAMCPYVPPHEFNLDFPHLILRYRAALEHHGQGEGFVRDQLTNTDRNGVLGTTLTRLTNWGTKKENTLTRGVLEKIAGIHKEAALPAYASKTLETQAQEKLMEVNIKAPAYGRKAVIYATCYGQYNTPETGMKLIEILALNGIETKIVYPECCGMPQFELGKVKDVAEKALRVSEVLEPYIDEGYDVIALVPSCTLMLKFEWPLLTQNEKVKKLSNASYDVSEYLVNLAKDHGLQGTLKPLEQGKVTVHIACHARAQNVGNKAAELLKLIPELEVNVIARCSGHGGSWGILKENFETALKVGAPVIKKACETECSVVSECPLAALHIEQGIERKGQTKEVGHPLDLLFESYGL
jgi:glycerol-3-phosphate dehydrogenase subunit C